MLILGSSSNSVLFLISRTGAANPDDLAQTQQRHIEAVDLLIASVQQHLQCENNVVLSNVRETPVDPILWLEEKMKACDRIVLVFSPLGKSNYDLQNEKDPFLIGMNLLLEDRKRKYFRLTRPFKFYPIYFGDNSTACIPSIIRSQNITCIQLPNKLNWFYQNLVGIKLQNIPEDQVSILKNKILEI